MPTVEEMARNDVQFPYTTLEFVETNPVQAYIDAENRMGSMRVALRGNVPADIKVYLSENFSAVTP